MEREFTDEPPPDGAWSTDDVDGWTIDGSDDHPARLADATALLDRELPDPRFVDTAYLRWIYRDNPLGRAVERHQQVQRQPSIAAAHRYQNSDQLLKPSILFFAPQRDLEVDSPLQCPHEWGHPRSDFVQQIRLRRPIGIGLVLQLLRQISWALV